MLPASLWLQLPAAPINTHSLLPSAGGCAGGLVLSDSTGSSSEEPSSIAYLSVAHDSGYSSAAGGRSAVRRDTVVSTTIGN